MDEHTVRLRIGEREIAAAKGASLLEALVASGLLLRTDCGARGLCGKCGVRVTVSAPPALSPPDETERKLLGEHRLARGERLACRARVQGETIVEIPSESLVTPEVVQKALPGFMQRLASPERLRRRQTRSSEHGVAVDLGTTTIAVYLCDLGSGSVTASTAIRNPQSIFGDDVISRIAAARDDAATLARLQRMAVSAIDWAVSALCRRVRIDPLEVEAVMAVGNSIMIHLLLGEDPSSMGVFPYRPLFSGDRHLPCKRIGLTFNPQAVLHTLPLIGGYLGADIVAAALAVEMTRRPPGTLLVDVGTNGELILATGKGFAATSCATGPALEGAAIRHGMQAGSGAITAVRYEPETGRVDCRLIQRDADNPQKAAGICGSGVISAVAAFLKAGAIARCGSFVPTFPSTCRRRDENDGLELQLVPARESRSGFPITITQADVRALQLAKGALRAGIDLLCRQNGMERPSRILLAGAFGSCIDAADALEIGMFPPLPASQIEAVGNAAGLGAVLALCDEAERLQAREIARTTMIFDLAGDPDFQNLFIKRLSF